MRLLPACLCLCFSSRNQKKENISSPKGAFFGILFVFLPCRLIRFQQQTIQNLKNQLDMNILKKLFGGQKTTEEVREMKEKDFDKVKYDGVRALRMHQFDLAAKFLEQALQLNAEDLECRDYLSRAYISMGNLQQAYAQLQKISEAQPDNVAVLLRMADVAYMMEDYIAMTDVCDKALQLDAENVETYFFYARACRGLGDAPRAVSMLTEAIGKRDDFYAARLLRGSILLDQAQLSEAELDATFLYEHIPGNEDVLLLKARVEKAQGKLKEAEQTYGKVMDVNPFSIDAYRERSIVRTILGDSAGAAEDEAAVKEMGAKVLEPSEGIEQKIKEKMRQMDPYKVFHNE